MNPFGAWRPQHPLPSRRFRRLAKHNRALAKKRRSSPRGKSGRPMYTAGQLKMALTAAGWCNLPMPMQESVFRGRRISNGRICGQLRPGILESVTYFFSELAARSRMLGCISATANLCMHRQPGAGFRLSRSIPAFTARHLSGPGAPRFLQTEPSSTMNKRN